MFANSQPLSEREAFLLRITTGVAAGVLLAMIPQLLRDHLASSDEGTLNSWNMIWTSTVVLVSLIVMANAAIVRRAALLIWPLIAGAAIFALVWHMQMSLVGRGYFDALIVTMLMPLVFITNELVVSADQARKVIAPYQVYFEGVWKRGVQLVIAIAFAFLFFAILYLGASLLSFIGFNWLDRLLSTEAIAYPLFGLAFAAAVQMGDVQPKLLANARGLALNVLSWLLPVITLVGGIFSVSLLFSGLEPLWKTKAATATLLWACVGFVLLMNAAFQQGDDERKVHVILKWSVRLAAFLLLVLAILAAWGLGLRINQYGLTTERCFAALGTVISLAYGVSYAIAAIWRGPWMARMKPVNIGLAVFMCALFVAFITPIAAPDRLTADNQVARLTSGVVKPEAFDWWLLRDETGIYGQKALDQLTKSPNATIADWAKRAKEDKIGKRPIGTMEEAPQEAARPDPAKFEVVFPKGAALPASFLNQKFRPNESWLSNFCLWPDEPSPNQLCRAALLDVDGDRKEEILFIELESALVVFKEQGSDWVMHHSTQVGTKSLDMDSLSKGEFGTANPDFRDIVIGEARFQINPLEKED